MSAPKYSVGQQVRYYDNQNRVEAVGKIGSVMTRYIYTIEGETKGNGVNLEFAEEGLIAYGGGGKTLGRKHRKHKRKTRKH
jgi:hypothetical protein